MAMNINILKKWMGLGLPCILVGITTLILLISTHNIGYAIGGFVAMTMLGILLGSLILRNPFSAMLEGQGILTIDLSSTGIINIFISKVNQPYIQNEKKGMNDIFDRETVYNLNPPISLGKLDQNEDGSLTLKLTKEEYGRAKFGMMQYPVLIYNSQIKSLLTKDFLSDQEKIAFSEHSIIYQNQKLHELTSIVRDFGRYVVELTKPVVKTSLLQNKWFWIIMIIFGGVVLLLFAPSMFTVIKGGMAGATKSLPAIVTSTPQVITPV